MNSTLAKWNAASEAEALEAMIACCGAMRWATAMVALRPISNAAELSAHADCEWAKMEEADWLQAFACHPRIGERKVVHASTKSAAWSSALWSSEEQSSASAAAARVLSELAEGNSRYEQQFGFTYIVCATGKTAEEMLAILHRRLASDRAAELHEAAGQQRQILQIRLGKWLME